MHKLKPPSLTLLHASLITGSLVVVLIGAHFIFNSKAEVLPLLGPDTSNHQATMDSVTAKNQGMSYHFMKVSQGLNFNDGRFPDQRTKSEAAGLIVGGYHFLEAGNGAAQCDHYIKQLKDHGGTAGIMLALDVELQNSTTGPSYKDVQAFLARCQPLTPGRTWVIYTGLWYWGNSKQKGYLGNPKAPPGTVLWVSIYIPGTGSFQSLLGKVGPQGNVDDPYAAEPINGWPEYAFRQYSASASVANLSIVDANVTYKGLAYLKNLAGIATAASGKPDLVVTDISWSPASPVAGNQVRYSATIKNQGMVATPAGANIGISFIVDGKQVSWASNGTTVLAAGASRIQTANGGPAGTDWLAAVGSHSVQATVDDLDLIDEDDETNNTLTEPLTVTGQAALRGDTNGDNRVNALDLAVIISRSGQDYPPADFNNDGTVGAADLAILLGNWTW